MTVAKYVVTIVNWFFSAHHFFRFLLEIKKQLQPSTYADMSQAAIFLFVDKTVLPPSGEYIIIFIILFRLFAHIFPANLMAQMYERHKDEVF